MKYETGINAIIAEGPVTSLADARTALNKSVSRFVSNNRGYARGSNYPNKFSFVGEDETIGKRGKILTDGIANSSYGLVDDLVHWNLSVRALPGIFGYAWALLSDPERYKISMEINKVNHMDKQGKLFEPENVQVDKIIFTIKKPVFEIKWKPVEEMLKRYPEARAISELYEEELLSNEPLI